MATFAVGAEDWWGCGWAALTTQRPDNIGQEASFRTGLYYLWRGVLEVVWFSCSVGAMVGTLALWRVVRHIDCSKAEKYRLQNGPLLRGGPEVLGAMRRVLWVLQPWHLTP